jgi:hypothetical protein
MAVPGIHRSKPAVLFVSDWLSVDGSSETHLVPAALDPAADVSGKLIPGTARNANLMVV